MRCFKCPQVGSSDLLDLIDNKYAKYQVRKNLIFLMDGAPPLWLSDEGIRLGITKLLDLDCCEEEIRLIQERRALQQWMLEEWKVNVEAHRLTSKYLPLISSTTLFDDLLKYS
jgi:hypothetical protein